MIQTIKKIIPVKTKETLKLKYLVWKYTKANKIFCISIQKTGTTSVGEFFKRFNFRVSTYSIKTKNKWDYYWYYGNYSKIFNSNEFKACQVFEDDPWWFPEFYKVIYHSIPNSKFILFERPKEKWFKSLLNHSNGKVPGITKIHCKVYRRELEYFNYLKDHNIKDNDSLEYDTLLELYKKKQHYINCYLTHNSEVKRFFKRHDPTRLFTADLEDKQKWVKLGQFIGIKVPDNFNVHENKTIMQSP